MKEAASESSMTVIAIILVGIVATIGGALINSLMNGVKEKAEDLNNGKETWGKPAVEDQNPVPQ